MSLPIHPDHGRVTDRMPPVLRVFWGTVRFVDVHKQFEQALKSSSDHGFSREEDYWNLVDFVPGDPDTTCLENLARACSPRSNLWNA